MKQLTEIQKRGIRRRIRVLMCGKGSMTGDGKQGWPDPGRREQRRNTSPNFREGLGELPGESVYFLGYELDTDRGGSTKPIHITEAIKDIFIQAGEASKRRGPSDFPDPEITKERLRHKSLVH